MLDKKPKIHEIHAKWDEKRECCLIPKEEYEDWDEISPKAFYSLYLPNADTELKEAAAEILARWYEKDILDYDDRNEFIDFVKNTLHDKIMRCKILEDRNIIWQVIDENQINIKDELQENNLAYSLDNSDETFDERWDKEFGQYMDGIQVMRADDAINLLKRMERFE